ncbi:MAG TPA: YceI family protein [Puia sp.]|nr:YceI family protein [Puia sp.]
MKASALFGGIAIVVAGIFVATNWTVDPANAKVAFSVGGPFGTVHGSFTGLQATIRFDPADLPGSSIEASIDASTVSSGIGLRNHHLRSEEQWLNTDKYPRISFRSARIERAASGYKVKGNLTLKNVTRPIEIPFTFAPNGNTGVFKGQFSFKRLDFDLGKPGGTVGEVITIDLDIPVKK